VKTVSEEFIGSGGVKIFWQAWLPEEPPKGAVVVVHGFGEHSGRYENLVNAIVPKGYGVYAIDHRGHGRSGGHRALIDKYAYLLQDLDVVFARVAKDHPGIAVFLLGHSMGGNIALSSALDRQDRIRGLLLSGPLVTTHGVAKPLIFLSRLLGKIAPKLGVKKLSAEFVSSDRAVVAAYESDPLVFHGSMPAGTGAALLVASQSFPARLASLHVPLLVVHGSNDKLVSVESGKTAYALAGSVDKSLTIYEGFAHEVMNEPGHETVTTDIAHWLDAHLPVAV
jgi:alpha-beta hydrolase superfamily lysophospholipase